jgi:hypothetical protein
MPSKKAETPSLMKNDVRHRKNADANAKARFPLNLFSFRKSDATVFRLLVPRPTYFRHTAVFAPKLPKSSFQYLLILIVDIIDFRNGTKACFGLYEV